MNIFQYSKNHLKIGLLLISLLIAFFTLLYTNSLVNKLAEREQKLIDLYAKGLEFIIKADDNEAIVFLYNEIVDANNSVPVLLVDENNEPINYRNIDIPKGLATPSDTVDYLKKVLEEMKSGYKPIEVSYEDYFKNYIFYKNSFLLTQLKYYPYVQLSIIAAFILIAYMAFSYSRKSEQNKVWVGMAKETAHQLGTPLSSLMAWMEYLKEHPQFKDEVAVAELEKDVKRLEIITERFSNIGSIPILESKDLSDVIPKFINYLKKRVSNKVTFEVQFLINEPIAKINISLFEWVLENVCKNAIDAMEGVGVITIIVGKDSEQMYIDIKDTGKGMTKKQKNNVFNPGFTTKKRGWGLGLTLAKRIVEEYHNGELQLKFSQIGKGTIFRILLSKH